MSTLSRATFLVFAIGCSLPAVPVTWYLSGVTFSDGGRAIGSFVYDADTNTYSSIRVSTTPGSGVTTGTANTAGKDYTQLNTTFSPVSNVKVGLQEALPTVKNVTGFLSLQFTTPLTNAGGTVSVTSVSSENVFTDNGATVAGPLRTVAGGNLVAANPGGPQTWYLSGVTFDDGSQAIGSFVFDAASGTFSQINIQTTTGTTFPAASYTNVFSVPSTSKNLTALTAATPVAQGRVLNLALAASLTNAPGSVAIALTTGVSAEGTCNSATCQSNGTVTFLGVIRNVVSGIVTTSQLAGYTRILSQIADGGGWVTSLLLTNLTDGPVAFTVSFFADTGTPVSISGIGTTVSSVVPARGSVNLVSGNAAAAITQAWAKVTNAQALSVTALLTLKNANAGGDQQGTVYGDPQGSNFIAVAFDNSGGATNGLALVNPDPVQSIKINAVGYDTNGNIILNDSSITLPPLGHTAFLFNSQPGFGPIATGQGTIRIFPVAAGSNIAPFFGVNGLLLKFPANHSLTNINVTNE